MESIFSALSYLTSILATSSISQQVKFSPNTFKNIRWR